MDKTQVKSAKSLHPVFESEASLVLCLSFEAFILPLQTFLVTFAYFSSTRMIKSQLRILYDALSVGKTIDFHN